MIVSYIAILNTSRFPEDKEKTCAIEVNKNYLSNNVYNFVVQLNL